MGPRELSLASEEAEVMRQQSSLRNWRQEASIQERKYDKLYKLYTK